MLLSVWELLVNIMELFLFCFYCDSLFDWKPNYERHRTQPFLFLLCLLFLMTYLNHRDIFPAVTASFFLVTDVCFVFLFFTGPWYLRLVYAVFFSAVCLVSEYVPLLVSQILLPVPLSELLADDSILRLPLTTLYILTIAIITLVIRSIKKLELHFRLEECLLYAFIALSGTATVRFLLGITVTLSSYPFPDLVTELALFNTVFLVLFFILLFYSFRLAHSRQENLRLARQNAILSMEEKEYRHLMETTRSLCSLKHDMNHHLDVIKQLAEEKNYDELTSYLSRYSLDFTKTGYFPSSGSTVLDCILTSKIQKADADRIGIRYSVFLPDTFHMDDILLTSLLGNLFDNAIEACIRLKNSSDDCKDPEIQFSIRPYQNMLIIHMENPCTGKYQYVGRHNLLSTGKPDPLMHGLGLARVRDIVEDADGILSLKPMADRFVVHILLPLAQNDSTDSMEDSL